MTKVQTNTVQTTCRRLTIPALLRKIRSVLFFRSINWLYVLELQTAVAIASRVPVHIVCYDSDNQCPLDVLRRIKGKVKDWHTRWTRADLCYVAYMQGKPIGHIWISQGKWHFRDADIWLSLPRGSAFLYDARVREEWRGYRVYPALISQAVDDLLASGYERLYLFGDERNAPALSAIAKLGFRCTEHWIRTYRILRFCKFRRDSRAIREGFHTVGEDPSPETQQDGREPMKFSSFGTLRRQFREYGFLKFAAVYGTRLLRALLPACVFYSADDVVVKMAEIPADKVTHMSGYHGRLATWADLEGLCSISPKPRTFMRFFRSGAICAVAEGKAGIVAMVWAHIGPVECAVDAKYKHGYRWRLQIGEAWIHNGESRPDIRNTYRAGVYVIAFYRLLEELAARGVSRCYGRIAQENSNSLKVHMRLHLRPVMYSSYRRIAFYGWYTLCHNDGCTITRTLRRAITLDSGHFGRSPIELPGQSRAAEPDKTSNWAIQ